MGQLVFQAALGGQVNLVGPNTASTFNINVPAVAGNMVTTGDTGTVTNTMLASSAYTAPGTIGSGTANTGAFTTLSASTSVTTPFVTSAAATSLLLKSAGTTAVTIDTSQNVGVGVTPSAWAAGYRALDIGSVGTVASGSNFLNLYNNLYVGANLTYKTTGYATSYSQSQSDGAHKWFTAPSGTAGNTASVTQAMTLDSSGNLLVGNTSGTSYASQGINLLGGLSNSQMFIGHASGTASGQSYAIFTYNGSGASGNIGSITQNGTTGVLFNITSDYRLKNNQKDLTGAKDFIMALKPKKWQWWDGSGEGVGFIAHEFMEVAKYSGHGEKDAVETLEIKDEDGNVTGTETHPIYQSIQPSSSEVMANLVAHIQNLETRLATLEAK